VSLSSGQLVRLSYRVDLSRHSESTA